MISKVKLNRLFEQAKDLLEAGNLIREQIISLKAKDDLIVTQGTALNNKVDILTAQVNLKLKNLEDRVKVLELK